MEDHHVDRPEVEVWQHMQLTGTNHPSGLIPFGVACSKRPRYGSVDELRFVFKRMEFSVRMSGSGMRRELRVYGW